MTRITVEVESDDVQLVFDEIVLALTGAAVWEIRVTYDEPGEDPKVAVIEAT